MRTVKALHRKGNSFYLYDSRELLFLYYANNLELLDNTQYYLLLEGNWIVQALPV